MPANEHQAPNRLAARVVSLFWRLTPNCKEVARLTSEGRDRALPFGTRTRLGLHRLFCKWCARYAEQLDLLREASRQMPAHLEETNGPALDSAARERLKRAVQDQAKGNS